MLSLDSYTLQAMALLMDEVVHVVCEYACLKYTFLTQVCQSQGICRSLKSLTERKFASDICFSDFFPCIVGSRRLPKGIVTPECVLGDQ